jgi:hypothetical protein
MTAVFCEILSVYHFVPCDESSIYLGFLLKCFRILDYIASNARAVVQTSVYLRPDYSFFSSFSCSDFCLRKYGRFKSTNPSNAIHLSQSLEWLCTETVLRRRARQGALNFGNLNPWTSRKHRASKHHSEYDNHEHENESSGRNISPRWHLVVCPEHKHWKLEPYSTFFRSADTYLPD